VIKATSIQLSLLMMFGISLGYINILLAAVPSSTVLCAVMGIFFYLATAFRLCALFTRTLLIYRVFKNSKKSAARLRYTSKQTQVVMCLSLVAIQLGLALICLPKSCPNQPDVHRRYVEESCEILTVQQDAAAFSFRAVITLACFFMAFQTRNVTSNFNESGFIFVCLCAEIVSTYFAFQVRGHLPTIHEKRMVQLFSTVINQVIFSAFMFLPKIFFITFKYEASQTRAKGLTKFSRFSNLSAQASSPRGTKDDSRLNVKISRIRNHSTSVDQPGLFPVRRSPYSDSVGSVISQDDVKTGHQKKDKTENEEMPADAPKDKTENGDLPADAQKDQTENGDLPAAAQTDQTENEDVPVDAQKALASPKLDDSSENVEAGANQMTKQVTEAHKGKEGLNEDGTTEGSEKSSDSATGSVKSAPGSVELATGSVESATGSVKSATGSDKSHGTTAEDEMYESFVTAIFPFARSNVTQQVVTSTPNSDTRLPKKKIKVT
jgi:hypothetical protein